MQAGVAGGDYKYVCGIVWFFKQHADWVWMQLNIFKFNSSIKSASFEIPHQISLS